MCYSSQIQTFSTTKRPCFIFFPQLVSPCAVVPAKIDDFFHAVVLVPLQVTLANGGSEARRRAAPASRGSASQLRPSPACAWWRIRRRRRRHHRPRRGDLREPDAGLQER